MNVHVATRPDNHRADDARAGFARDVIAGLSQQPKQLPPKYFYDEAGSHLFEQITLLPEYYPTRTELKILRDRGTDIASIIPQGAALVEFGAGATTKVRLLLQHCAFDAYVPVDISGAFLNGQADALRADFPYLAVHAVVADFTTPFVLPDAIKDMPKVRLFSRLDHRQFRSRSGHRFLRSAREILGDNATMIVGVDLEKDERVLHAAYNDAAGITAQFNENVLQRINRELGGDFNLSAFTHRAIYSDEYHRIEMHLSAWRHRRRMCAGRRSHSTPAKASTPSRVTNTASNGCRRWRGTPAGRRRRRGRTMASCFRFTPCASAPTDFRNPPAERNRLPRGDDQQNHCGQRRQNERREKMRDRNQDKKQSDADQMRQLEETPDYAFEQKSCRSETAAARR